MARKKATTSPIVNGLDDTHIVEKSRPLMLMKEVPFELGELKVLDTYLSRINARDPESTTVRFRKEEYEDLMGIERMRPERLNKYVTALQGKTVRVPDSTARNGWRNYNLFDETGFEQDENGQWWVDICCTSKAKKLFFNLKEIGYIQYQLKNILPLTSKYSVLLYIYLLANRYRKSWEISVEELRIGVFRCFAERYKEYKFFNQEILKKAITEVNEKTDLTFAYESIRVGRPVKKIKFNLIKDEVVLPEPSAPARPQLPARAEESGEEYEQFDLFGLGGDKLTAEERGERQAICEGFQYSLYDEFTVGQLTELYELSKEHVDKTQLFDLVKEFGTQKAAMDSLIEPYIQRKIWLCNSQTKPVVHRYSFVKRAVAEDWR